MKQAVGAVLCLVIASSCQTSWTTHRDPSGFTVETPAGWKVSSQSGRVQVAGPQQQQVVVWPVFVSGVLDARSAAPVLWRLAQTAMPIQWSAPQPAGAAAVRMLGRSAGRVGLATLAWVPSPKGTAAWLYCSAAPEAAYNRQQEIFARILGSFRVLGAKSGTANAQPAVKWVRWEDPREKAFSLEFPEGWKIEGGMFRYAPVDTRGAWQAVSPDGAIRLWGGDQQLPTFTEPNQMLAMTGFREGSTYSPGYGVQMIVRRYLPGLAFVKDYVTSGAARLGCAELAFTGERNRTDFASAINAIYQQYPSAGVSLQMTAGDVNFTCRQESRAMSGYYFAGTQFTKVASMPGGLWRVEHLFGYLAPREKAAQAESVLQHAIASMQVNPQWAGMQSNVAANTSRIVSRTQAEISNIIDSTYRNRQASLDEISRRRSNATLGVVDVVDPATGREFKVESSSNYYWIDHRGTIAGTETDTRPGIDFRELTRLP